MKSLYDVIPWAGSPASSSSDPPSEVGDRDVVAHVDQLLALAFLVPVRERVGERLTGRLNAEVDVTRRPAERRGGLTRRHVVDRHRAAERHVEVRVRDRRTRAARTSPTRR
jgi:hypothetical protein